MQKFEKEKISVLSEKLSERIIDILDHFNIEYTEQDEWIYCPCPVHDGDKKDGFSIRQSDIFPNQIVWSCWTHHCEKEYINSVLGLLRGILSRERGEEVGFPQAVSFGFKFLNFSPDDIKVDESQKDKSNFIRCANSIFKQKKEANKVATRAMVVAGLCRPVEYYLNKGFNQSTLDFFDVGICKDPSKPMYNRIVVPVYDDSHAYMTGCIGRSLEEKPLTHKWVNSKGLNTGDFLYNYWNAKEFIEETSSVVVVEGQGDVWRLHEAGIRNSVGMFGCYLSDYQRIILERSGALNLIILTDSDEAGRDASARIKTQCERLFNIYTPDITPHKDVGDMSVSEIQQILNPQLQGLI
jgi:5S rRNA maturation endonuclease (ribonuclease M5)